AGMKISGFEIHCGRITRSQNSFPFTIYERDGRFVNEPEGALSADGRVLGTSIHGCMDAPSFRRNYLNQIRGRKGLWPLEGSAGDAKELRLQAYDRFAELLATNLDFSSLETFAGVTLA